MSVTFTDYKYMNTIKYIWSLHGFDVQFAYAGKHVQQNAQNEAAPGLYIAKRPFADDVMILKRHTSATSNGLGRLRGYFRYFMTALCIMSMLFFIPLKC